jgi:fructose-specific phosphotransferase system IIA component
MIEELLDEDLILILDKVEDKFKLIEIMVDKTLGKGLIVTREPILDKIREREELESTGVVEGIALPHARTEAVKDLLLVVAIVKQGLDFKALDGKPVYIVFLIVAPEEAKKKYINVLARISRMCRQEEFRKALREAESPASILKIIKEFDIC